MPPLHQAAIEKIRRDHAYMNELMERIKSTCTEVGSIDNCDNCRPERRNLCRGSIEHLIRQFVEFALKHNLVESMYMENNVPQSHRIAHNRAHMGIAELLKSIRVVYADDGNGILAIEGVDKALRVLQAHIEEFDQQLECYLLGAD